MDKTENCIFCEKEMFCDIDNAFLFSKENRYSCDCQSDNCFVKYILTDSSYEAYIFLDLDEGMLELF